MPYGIIKVDTVTFTNDGVDKSVTLSGLVQNPTFSGNVTVTGTLSGVTVTGTTANFTSGNFTNISGGTHTITSGVFAAGSAASPSITFTGDLNTGIYSPGADQVAISTGGTKRIEIQADGDIDIDNGGVFYDATNNRLAIGTTSPGALLHVEGGTENAIIGSSARKLYFRADTGGVMLGTGAGQAGNGVYFSESSNFVYAQTNSLERARIDSSGRLLVGTPSDLSGGVANTSFQLAASSGSGVSTLAQIYSFNSGGGVAALDLCRSKSTTLGTNTTVANNDYIGSLNFKGANGSSYLAAASVSCEIDGAVSGGGAADMPGRLIFSTTADGASSPTERWRYSNNGETQIRNMAEVFPVTDNACLLGKNGNRWSAVWAANGTIQTSDKRTKTEVLDATLGADFVKSLRPVSYKWIEGGKKPTGEFDEDNNYIYESVPGTRTHWGFIAQEVKQAVDAAGVDFGGWVLTDKDDPDSQQALRYDQFIAPLTKALQEALEKIETLEAAVTALQQP